MKKMLMVAGLAITGVANAQLFDQSQLVNGVHASGHNSTLEAGETIFGFGAQTANNNVMSDDFTLGTAANLTHIRLFTYQTGATAPSITGVNFAVGASATTSLTAATILSTGWYDIAGQGVFRTNTGDTTGTTRRIQFVDVEFNQALAAGTHFLSFSFSGTGTSGPWAVPLPTSLATHGQNAQQSLAGGAFAPAAQGTVGADASFAVFGQPVPEPSSMAALGLGIAAILRRRRK